MTIKHAKYCLLAVGSLLVLAPPAPNAALQVAGVSLKVSHESAPPGGIAQIKVTVTEPKPISTGRMALSFGRLDRIAGIAAMSPANDTFGVAQLRNLEIRFSVLSTTSSFGTSLDYPILTVAARVPASTPLGTVIPVSLGSDGIAMFGPRGAVYPYEVDDGSVTVARGISIDDVTPGSADLPAGSLVTIVGHGFVPATKVRFNETILSSVRYVDSTHMQVALASAARMHGMRIRAENPDGRKTTYFSYQRTRRQGTSAFPAFQNVVPLFPLRMAMQARVRITAVSTALALQNIGTTTVGTAVDLLAADGQVLATRVTSVGPSRFAVREISELFGMSYVPGSIVRVRSAGPIQVMGIEVGPSGDATPITPW
jgi:hypothetical protein